MAAALLLFMMREAMAALAAMGVLAMGCGGSVTTGGTTGGTTTGSGGGTTTGSGGGSTGTTTGSGGGPCAGFEDQQGSSTVTVRFRNNSGQDIYLPGNCTSVEYLLLPADGGDGNHYAFDPSCLQTCQDLQTQQQYDCGACLPQVYRIAPGETRDVPWDGTALSDSVTMPEACWFAPSGNTTCNEIHAAAAGSYVIDATGHAECGDNCTCDEKGVCSGYGTGATAKADFTIFTFPADAPVEVVFGPCAFECPPAK